MAMLKVHSMNTCASTIVLLLVLTSCRGDAHSRPAPTPTTDILRATVIAHYHAIEDNRLDEAMHYYHSQSPEVVQTRENIELGLSQFLLKTTTMTFCYVGQDHEFAVATAKHRYLIISGIKFVEKFADVVYLFREDRGVWKVWAKGQPSKNRGDQYIKMAYRLKCGADNS